MLTQSKRPLAILLSAAVLLLIPFIAMQFTDEVNWTLFDFVMMGALLLGTGFLIELALRKVSKTKHRLAICIAIFAAFLLIWAELAVGIFGSPFAGS